MFKLCICVLIFSAAAYTATAQEYDPAYDDYNYADEETKASWSRGREHPLDEGYDEEYTGDYGDDDDGPYGDVIGIPVDDHDDGDVEVGVHSNNTEEAEAVQASIGRVAKHDYSAEVPPDYQFEDNRSDAKEENALENVKVARHENDNLISLDELHDALLKNNNENKPNFEDKELDSADVADTVQNIENSQIEEDIEENIDHEVDDALFENNNENEPNFEDKELDSADVADTAQSIENSQIEEGIEENIDHEVDDALFEYNNDNEPNFEDKVLDSADVADIAQSIENSQIVEGIPEYIKNEKGNNDQKINDALLKNNNENEPHFEDKDSADAADIKQSIESSSYDEGYDENNHIYIDADENKDQNEDTLTETVVNVSPVLKLENDTVVSADKNKDTSQKEENYLNIDVIVHGNANATDIAQSIESSSYEEGYDEDLFSFGDYKLKNSDHIYKGADENKDQKEDILTENIVKESPVLKLGNDTVGRTDEHKDTSQKEENTLYVDDVAKWLELNSGEISDKKVEYINKLFKELTDQLNREEDEDSDYANYSDDSDESKAEGDKVKYLLDILLEKLKTPDSIETGIFNDKDASTSQEKTDGEIVDDLKNVDKSVEVVVEQVIDEKATEQATETITFPTMDVKDLPPEAFDQLMVQFTAFNADEIDTQISDKKVEYINKLYKKLTDQLNREEDEDTGYANYSDDSLPNPDNINADEPKAEGDKVKDPLDILLEKPKTPDSIETGIFNDKDASISQEKTDEEIVDDLKNVDKSVEVVVEQVIDEKATEQASETTFPTMDVKDLPPEAFDQLMVQFTAFNADEIDTEIKKDGEVISYNLTAGEDLEVTSPNFPGAYPTNNIMEFYVTNLGPGIEFNITDLHIRGAMGDYLLVKIPDVHVEKGVVFTYHLNEHRAYRLMGVHRVFVRFVAKQGLNSLSGFRMTFRNVETTLWSPTQEEEDIPTPAPLLPKPPATLTVHLGGVTVSEFQFMKEEFTRLLADMATMYINANGIEEGLNSTSEVTQITTVSSCNVNWEDFNNCVRVTFGVPLVYEDGISRLSEEELKTMWETYVGQDPFAQRLSSMGIGLFQIPNESRVQMTWMMLGFSVLFSAVLLAFALWRYSCFESYTKMKKTFSETDSTRDKKRGLDLYPTPHQTLPPLYAENDEKWAAKYEESTRVDMGGFTNRSFARDDEILDIDSDEDVNRRRDGFATDV